MASLYPQCSVNTNYNQRGETSITLSSKLHWKRTCYVSLMWTFTLAFDVYSNLPEPVEMGWKMENSKYEIQWEDEDREREIKQNLLF